MAERDLLVEAVLAERDSALEEARFERQRAEQALARNETLRQELGEARDRLRQLIADEPAPLGHLPPPPGQTPLVREEADLGDRLRLAMDTNRRLERVRVHLQEELDGARKALEAEQETVERLRRRLKAVEGQLRIARG
ncbi:MAG: hypothetical protein H6741_02690 [Alphaproteobacteria bacterium]|nr:hypothetical protein [Alphaproteobacteria bacterium]MCB9791612.1 hypothetical protein [Alphaproteobacteria bacterium]